MLTESICMGYLTMDVTLLRKLFGMRPEMWTISRNCIVGHLPLHKLQSFRGLVAAMGSNFHICEGSCLEVFKSKLDRILPDCEVVLRAAAVKQG
ncbi:hypothetical protein Patl1_12821 [Pistacia atlantica]|uniref:Uncharacterized protein n=1 Tax=Pistacia atlantica TaxID=434234 RepID=A0ACC1AWG1_9ROSI|nr:hypothetical protein Patl1_12821 [Pistacia atlantica]